MEYQAVADLKARIEQFRVMAEANPNDELAFFSLGRALAEYGDLSGAVAAFGRVIEINPKMSKAYQLLANAQLENGDQPAAIETLKRGATIAHERGDLMPKNDMLPRLKEFGVEMPELASAGKDVEVGEGQVLDMRTGMVGPKMPRPPFSNKLGQFIWQHTSAASWKEWIGMGTKVINELRLPLSDPAAQKVFDQHMLEFLNLTELWEQEKNKP
jgi:Fe-S cluster biosynthesis and repair protein YggX